MFEVRIGDEEWTHASEKQRLEILKYRSLHMKHEYSERDVTSPYMKMKSTHADLVNEI